MREVFTNPEVSNLARSASWYRNRFQKLIADYSPDQVNAKIHYDVKNQAGLINHGCPLGVLALCCYEASIELELLTKQKLKGWKNFNLQKGNKPFEWIDMLKDNKAYWNDDARCAALLSAFSL